MNDAFCNSILLRQMWKLLLHPMVYRPWWGYQDICRLYVTFLIGEPKNQFREQDLMHIWRYCRRAQRNRHACKTRRAATCRDHDDTCWWLLCRRRCTIRNVFEFGEQFAGICWLRNDGVVHINKIQREKRDARMPPLRSPEASQWPNLPIDSENMQHCQRHQKEKP